MRLEDLFRNFYVQTRVINEGSKKVVVKCYNSSTSIKWYLISTTFRRYPYTSDPYERMKREIDFFTYNWKEVRVPKIIDFDLSTLCLYREFINGNEIRELRDFKKLGEALKYIHENSFALGDTKIENFLLKDNKIVIIDAEQAIQSTEREYFTWDLLVLALSLSYRFLTFPSTFFVLYKNVLEGYQIDKEQAKGLIGIDKLPIISLMPFTHYTYFKKIVEQFL